MSDMEQTNKAPVNRRDSIVYVVEPEIPDDDAQHLLDKPQDAQPESSAAAQRKVALTSLTSHALTTPTDPDTTDDDESKSQLTNTSPHDCNHHFQMTAISDRPHRCSLKNPGVCLSLRSDRMDPKKDKKLRLVLQCVGTKAAPGCGRLTCRSCHQLSAPRHRDYGSKGRKLRAQGQMPV